MTERPSGPGGVGEWCGGDGGGGGGSGGSSTDLRKGVGGCGSPSPLSAWFICLISAGSCGIWLPSV